MSSWSKLMCSCWVSNESKFYICILNGSLHINYNNNTWQMPKALSTLWQKHQIIRYLAIAHCMMGEKMADFSVTDDKNHDDTKKSTLSTFSFTYVHKAVHLNAVALTALLALARYELIAHFRCFRQCCLVWLIHTFCSLDPARGSSRGEANSNCPHTWPPCILHAGFGWW